MKKEGIIDRRSFLRLSTTMGAGVFLMSNLSAFTLDEITATEARKIPMRPLGKTGVMLPILSLGIDRPDNRNVLKAAFKAGLFHFDTAHSYQNGKNEELLGNFFERKARDKYFISTKIMFDYPLRDNFEEELNRKLDISLRRLKMDYVDLLYLHSIHRADKLKDERVIAAVKKIKADGKARFIGFSSQNQLPELVETAIAAGIYDVALISYNFRIKNLNETNNAIKQAAEAGMGIIAMKTMDGGTEQKKINAQACLKWIWQNKYITTAVPELSGYAQLEECIAATQGSLTADEAEYLTEFLT
ncbi:aldo/keto reductase [Viscerimonas tarda]